MLATDLVYYSEAIFGIVFLLLIIFILIHGRRTCSQKEKNRDIIFEEIAKRYGLQYVKNSQECAGGLLRHNYGVFRTIEGILGEKTIKIEDTYESTLGGSPKFWQFEDDTPNTRCYVDGHEVLIGSFRKSEDTIISFLESKK